MIRPPPKDAVESATVLACVGGADSFMRVILPSES
jgi:hypothetical protein